MNINGLNDSHKRTDISQLLNPASREPPHAFAPTELSPLGPPPPQHDQHGGPYHAAFGHPSSFHLRAANWDQVHEDPNKRRQDNNPARVFPHSQIDPVFFSEQGSRALRTRPGDMNNFAMDGTVWGAPHDPANMQYNAPAIVHMYSEERTVLSGDYAPGNQYPQWNPEQPQANIPPSSMSTWQVPQRASVRLVARETSQEPAMQQRFSMPPTAYYQTMALPFAQPIPFEVQPPPQKRPPPEPVEDLPAPKAKKAKTRAKTNGDGTASTSKRGYNAKKRSEAAQIVAQNAQMMPTMSYMHIPGEPGKDANAGGRMTMLFSNGAQPSGTEASGPFQPELQFARCMSNRYRAEQFPRCVSCTRRWAGDTCRFQGIRYFLKDAQRNIKGVSFVDTQKPDAPMMNFPNKWNVQLEPSHIRRTKVTIAKALLPILRLELKHLGMPEIILRPRESEVRATCDTCMTSIFSSSWMCRLCGREACAECFEQVKELTEDQPGASQHEMVSLQARREKHAHANPFFLSCTRRNEHHAKDFCPMSRFCREELSQAINDMEALLLESDVASNPAHGIDPALNGRGPVSTLNPSTLSVATHLPELSTSNINGSVMCIHPDASLTIPALRTSSGTLPQSGPHLNGITSVPSAGEQLIGLPFHETLRFTDAELTEDVFQTIWAKGQPLVVTGLLSKFKIQWTPEYFIEKYNPQPCLIIECQTDLNKRVTVGEFFSWFGKYENRTQCWKLKDWPPSVDFKMAFPELYEDFSNAVPVPNHVRRDGVLNIASHFPSNTVAPDLGPKMYNAMAAFQTSGSKGSTRLHMDMADAMNIMTYATPAPDGSPGCAAWDLFRAEDSDSIRHFLRKKFRGAFQNDPIHAQQFYLDNDLRKELFESYGVKSHRVYQRPGEAVFIPAGCAHQVANMADCVKVAVDFVSPENIARCEKLTREFREQNQSMVWKEDVLQLRTMMWFAWLSCCRQES